MEAAGRLERGLRLAQPVGQRGDERGGDAELRSRRAAPRRRRPRARPCRRRRTRTSCRSCAASRAGSKPGASTSTVFAARSSGSARARGRSPSERQKPSASSSSWPGRAHRDGDRRAADPDLERLLDGDAVALAAAVRAAGGPRPRARRVRRSLHAREAYGSRLAAPRRLGRVQVLVVGSGASRACARVAPRRSARLDGAPRGARETPGSRRSDAAIRCGPTTPRGCSSLGLDARRRPRRDRARGSARRRHRRRAAPRGIAVFGPGARGRADRGLEDASRRT